ASGAGFRPAAGTAAERGSHRTGAGGPACGRPLWRPDAGKVAARHGVHRNISAREGESEALEMLSKRQGLAASVNRTGKRPDFEDRSAVDFVCGPRLRAGFEVRGS